MKSLPIEIRRAACKGAPLGALILIAFLTGCQAAGPASGPLRGLELAQEWMIAPQSSTTKASLRSVCAVDERTCWAAGSLGTVLRTVDGGESWSRCPVVGGEELDFRSLFALDARTAWVANAGAPATIWHTADGGANWTRQYLHATPGAFFDSIAFWDARRGLVFSDPVDGDFLILKTDDAGAIWTPVPADKLPKPQAGEAGFAAGGTCLCLLAPAHAWIGLGGIERARVLRTSDSGANWQVADTPMMAGNASSGIFSVLFLDALRGAAVGGDYKRPDTLFANAIVTEDGGQTWRYPRGDPPRGYRSSLARWPQSGTPDAMLAVGTTGIDVSIDGGENWRPIAGGPFNSVHVEPSGSAGWAVGPDGAIARITRNR